MDQENKMKYIAVLLTILIFSGCSFKELKPTNYYTLESTISTTYSSKQQSLVIAQPKINAPYHSKNIFFTQKPYVIESYAINQWVDYPALIIQNMLYDTFQRSSMFKNILLDTSATKANLTLQTHIQKLFHTFEDNNSYAILQLKFELVQSEKTLETFFYSKKILCEENTPYGFIKASNQAFKEIQTELLKSLNQTI